MIRTLPSFRHGLLIIAIYIAINLVVTLLLMGVQLLTPALDNWNIFINFSLTFFLTLLLARYILQVNTFDKNWVSPLIFIVLLPAIISISILTEGIVSLIPMPQVVAEYFAKMVPFNLVGYLTIGIAAPILEELIFRGVLLKAYLTRYSPSKAIIFSALIFGIAHLNPWQFIAAFAIGGIIGWLYYKTKSIWPGIFIHFVNNTFSFYFAFTYRDINIRFYDACGSWQKYMLLIIACIAICFLAYKILQKIFFKSSPQETTYTT